MYTTPTFVQRHQHNSQRNGGYASLSKQCMGIKLRSFEEPFELYQLVCP